ncbi:MAG: 4Fe-4S binding protein [Anaerolineaceae bacterium]
MSFLKNSTRSFFAEARKTKNISFYDTLHGYYYLSFPYMYIGNAMGVRNPEKFYRWVVRQWWKVFPASRERRKVDPNVIQFADTYHGKVVPLETANKLVTIDREITYRYPEQVIPYKLARDIIMHDPGHIIALDCPCRVNWKDPCKPLDVCLVIGEPFASMIIEHNPHHARWIKSQEAMEILKAEEDRGHVHHAFFKQAALNRFYAICNCCSCCCGAMQAHQHGNPMLASSGYLGKVDETVCLGCGTCEEFCQFHAIKVLEDVAHVDEAVCMGCGVCVSHCPNDAVELVLAPQRGVPMEIPV